jgi:hypothetical protein
VQFEQGFLREFLFFLVITSPVLHTHLACIATIIVRTNCKTSGPKENAVEENNKGRTKLLSLSFVFKRFNVFIGLLALSHFSLNGL